MSITSLYSSLLDIMPRQACLMFNAKQSAAEVRAIPFSPCKGCVNISELQCGRQQILCDLR